jgi:succinate dehydrogenase / fumarate reductase flavoprotein subunit
MLHERLPGISESARVFSGVDVTRQPIPVLPTAHYCMGGIPANYHGEAIRPSDDNPDATVPGLMAAGEAACVSVHGANRLGCNSLLDIVVFGRAAALRCAEKFTAKAAQPELPPNAGEATLARFDRLRNAKGGTPTAALRLQMQNAMQSYATVFRTADILQDGKEALRKVWNGLSDIGVADRSMIWNSDLVETLEFENLLLQATALKRPTFSR